MNSGVGMFFFLFFFVFVFFVVVVVVVVVVFSEISAHFIRNFDPKEFRKAGV